MKRNIKDIFDCYSDENIRLRETPAVHDERVCALINARLGKENIIMNKTHRKLPIILIAAVAMVLLMGAGVVAATGGITNWFSESWEMTTGETITEEHLELIDGFSQAIGLSETSEGVTVTVDSAAVGEDVVYILITAESDTINFSQNRSPLFEDDSWAFAEVTNTLNGSFESSGAFGWQCTDDDGKAYFIMMRHYSLVDESQPMTVTLNLKGLHINLYSQDEEYPDMYIDGNWNFEFTLEHNETNHISLIDDGVVYTVTQEVFDLDSSVETQSYVTSPMTADLTELILSEFGIYVTYNVSSTDVLNISRANIKDIVAVTNDGSEISVAYTESTQSDDGSIAYLEYLWQVPVNIDEVEYIRIGDTAIAVPHN